MKKIAIFAIVALLLLPTVLAISNNSKGPKEPLEKIEFIHWKKDFAKPTTKRLNHLHAISS
jgi:hypothetical protein